MLPPEVLLLCRSGRYVTMLIIMWDSRNQCETKQESLDQCNVVAVGLTHIQHCGGKSVALLGPDVVRVRCFVYLVHGTICEFSYVSHKETSSSQ